MARGSGTRESGRSDLRKGGGRESRNEPRNETRNEPRTGGRSESMFRDRGVSGENEDLQIGRGGSPRGESRPGGGARGQTPSAASRGARPGTSGSTTGTTSGSVTGGTRGTGSSSSMGWGGTGSSMSRYQDPWRRYGGAGGQGALTPWSGSSAWASPFGLMRSFSDQMERLFDSFGTGRLMGPAWDQMSGSMQSMAQSMWSPQIEVFQREGELVVRADLPGMSKDDVHVDIDQGQLTIQGSRMHSEEGEHEGVYQSERSYGSFVRTIPLPEGVEADRARATYRDGVLEITMPAPRQTERSGRRIDID